MSHDPGPLEEIGENLTGRAAGHFSPREDGDFHGTSDTQAPYGRGAAPLARRDDREEGEEAEEDEDRPARPPRDEDADGAPEL